jgi:hypothetical protein
VLGPFGSESDSALHLLNDSRAFATPGPTLTAKLRDGFFEVSEPEKLDVSIAGDGEGAVVTIPVGEEMTVLEPPLFDAVTTTRSAYPTSLFCTT